MKITKKNCVDVLNILIAEGSRHRGGWLGVLNDATNEPNLLESVASLSHMTLSQTNVFVELAMRMLPKYMADHPEIRDQNVALNILITQLCVRMIAYVYKHTMEVEELGSMFDFEKEVKDKE
jgi:hypothetical protein